MSEEQHHDDAENESGIKTPKQLITVVAAAIIVPVLVIIMLTQFVTLDNKKSPGSQALTASAVAARIAPVASDAVFDASIVVAAKTGKQVFEAQCTTCHTAGLLGDQYVGIEPGSDDKNLANGDLIKQTQSAVVLENLIGQLIFNKAADAGSAAPAPAPAPGPALAPASAASAAVSESRK